MIVTSLALPAFFLSQILLMFFGLLSLVRVLQRQGYSPLLLTLRPLLLSFCFWTCSKGSLQQIIYKAGFDALQHVLQSAVSFPYMLTLVAFESKAMQLSLSGHSPVLSAASLCYVQLSLLITASLGPWRDLYFVRLVGQIPFFWQFEQQRDSSLRTGSHFMDNTSKYTWSLLLMIIFFTLYIFWCLGVVSGKDCREKYQ